MANTFGHQVIRAAVGEGYTWERIIKAFPDLDEEEYRKFYIFLTEEQDEQ